MNIGTIIATLKADEAAIAITLKHDEAELIAHLKAFYERVYGRVSADIHDWTHAAAEMKVHVESKAADEVPLHDDTAKDIGTAHEPPAEPSV